MSTNTTGSQDVTIAASSSPPSHQVELLHRTAALPPPLVLPTRPVAPTAHHNTSTLALTAMPADHPKIGAASSGGGCPFMTMMQAKKTATAPADDSSSTASTFTTNPSLGLPIPHDILTPKELSTILRMLPDALLCVRPDGIIVDCNEKTLSMFGYARQELIGKSCNCLLPEHLRAGHNEQMRSAFMLNEIREMGRRRSVVGQHHDGEQLELSIHLSPFRLVTFEEEQMLAETSPSAEEARQHIGQSLMLTVVRDITERTRMALSRQRAMQRQKLMDEFLRLINHETRTSLHAIHHSLADLHTEIETVCSTMHSQVEQLRQEWTVASTPTGSTPNGAHMMSTIDSVDSTPDGSISTDQILAAVYPYPSVIDQSQPAASMTATMTTTTILPASPSLFSPITPVDSIASTVTVTPNSSLPFSSTSSSNVTSPYAASSPTTTPNGTNSIIPRPLRKRLDTVQTATERMGLILSNMIDYQNLQSGNIVTQLTTFQVSSLLQTLIENHQKRAASLGIRLQIYIPEEIPAVRGNAELLVKCLGALVDNAVKASRAGQRVVVRCTSMKSVPMVEPASKLGRQTSRDITEGMKDMKLRSSRATSSSPHLKPIDRIRARTDSRSPSRTRNRTDSLGNSSDDGSLPIHLCFQVMDNGTGFGGVPYERLTPFRPSRLVTSDALRNTPSPAAGKNTIDSENDMEVLNANADVSTTRSTGNGLGLGIPIARLGTRSLKGTFEIISKPQTAASTATMIQQQEAGPPQLHSAVSLPLPPTLTLPLPLPESSLMDRSYSLNPDFPPMQIMQPDCTCASSSPSSPTTSVQTDLCSVCLNVQSAFTTVCQLILPFSYIPPSQPQQQLLDASAQSKIVEWITSPQLASTRKSFHILIVEDNAINCKILVHLLKKRGFTSVTTAADGELALKVVDARAVKVREENMKRKERNDVVGEEKESYEKEEFSCILMDCEMPVMDGFTCTRELRARYAAASSSAASSSSIPPPIPIVALTANATYACQRQCFDAEPLHADSLFFTLAALPPFAQYPLALSPFFLNSQRPIGGGGK